MTRLSKSRDWRGVFTVPLGIAIASWFGFAAAFLFGEIGQWLSWAGLGLPIAVIIWVMAREGLRRRLFGPAADDHHGPETSR